MRYSGSHSDGQPEAQLSPSSPTEFEASVRPDESESVSEFKVAEFTYSHTGTQQDNRSKHVFLSWAPFFPIPPIEVNTTHEDYILYQESMSYIESKGPYTTFRYPQHDWETGAEPAHTLPPAFGRLMNMLLDTSRPPSPHSTLAHIAVGMAYMELATLSAQTSNDGPENQTSPGPLVLQTMWQNPPSDSSGETAQLPSNIAHAPPGCRVPFLITMVVILRREITERRSAISSPMPWSRLSVELLSASRTSAPLDMSHFPLPTRAELDKYSEQDDPSRRYRNGFTPLPLDIPWLNSPHDGFPLSSTPSVYVYTRRKGRTPSLYEDAALWVGAMTFGLLETVTAMHIPETLLLSSPADPGKRFISGHHLAGFLSSWCTYMVQYPWPNSRAHLERGREVFHLLEHAFAALDEDSVTFFGGIFSRAGIKDDHRRILSAIAFSTMALCGMALSIWPDSTELKTLALESIKPGGRAFWEHVPFACMHAMHGAGWCPHTTSYDFLNTIPQVSVYSALFRLPPFIRRAPDEHRDCTEHACKLYTIADTHNYVPRHVGPSCTCAFVAPPVDDVARLLSAGTIPVVVFDGQQLRVEPAVPGAYVAISHVWVDGLGSASELGLPMCQVSRLGAHTAHFVPPPDPDSEAKSSTEPRRGAFWIDALCVPAAGAPRKQAIRMMGRTYKEAGAVLVLDACIRAQPPNAPLQDLMMAVATSGWARRVWTLQEGLFARQLVFELADGALQDIEGAFVDSAPPNDGADLDAAEATSFGSYLAYIDLFFRHVPLLAIRIRRALLHQTEVPYSFGEVVELMDRREITKAEDETVSVASLLSLNIDALLAITGADAAEQRMRECLLQLKTIPRVLPFLRCPKLALPGFHWAPRSLSQLWRMRGTGEHARCTADGLRARFDFVSLSTPVKYSVQDASDPDAPAACRLMVIAALNHTESVTYSIVLNVFLEDISVLLAVNGLLLVEDCLPPAGDKGAPCVAVVSHHKDTVSDGSDGSQGSEENHPARCTYLASGFMIGSPHLHRSFPNGLKTKMGEVCTMHVSLG